MRIPPSRLVILRELAPGHLIQPATALWRVYEIEVVLTHAAFSGRVLDLGCGDGNLGRAIFRQSPGATVVGVEPDRADAAAAVRSGVYQTVHSTSGDSVPEPDGSFDHVFSNSVLEHIPVIEPVLQETSRLLHEGGTFCFTVPSEQFHDCLSPGAVERWLARRRGRTPGQMIDRRLQHFRYWSPDQWREVLARVALRVTAVLRYFAAPAVRAWERLSTWTGGLAFELFRRRRETRAVQRGLALPLLQRMVPSAVAYAILRAIVGPALGEPAEVHGMSGGLLIIAEKIAAR